MFKHLTPLFLVLAAGPALAADPSLSVVNHDGVSKVFTPSQLAKMPRQTVKVVGHDNEMAEYEGVVLATVLEEAGVMLGKELRGARLLEYLLLEASDGYRVVFALSELDPTNTQKLVLLADRKNKGPLPEREGPFRLVVPDEKRQARWIRMVVGMKVQSVSGEKSPAKP